MEREEQEVKKKGQPFPLNLDYEKLLAGTDDDDEEPPLPVVDNTIAAADDDVEQKQREELRKMRDKELEESIVNFGRTLKMVGHNLPDGGVKMRASIKRCQDELDRRRLRRLVKDDDGCEKLTESKAPNFTSASDGITLEASLPVSQSLFAAHFSKKLDNDNPNSRTVNAFGSELSVLGRCGRGRDKIKYYGKFSPKAPPMTTVSSRQSPFQCPTNLSVDGDKHVHLNYHQNGGHISIGSPRVLEQKVSSFVSKKRKPYQVMSSNNVRPRNQKTVVLVDEEEPELSESMELADEPDECMKDSKIYYPSSDDPESVEICYSDMECLNPQAYLSSTIMNFYIRYLQQNSPIRARSDYHFFNTYFYNKLKEAVLKKNDQESYFIKFRRWWKGVDIFHKSYILLPIHETVHWSLVIICIPDKEDESGPILLHLDSLGLHSSKVVFDKIKSFLIEEWKYLKGEVAPSDLSIADRIWKNLPRRIEEKKISVPQQKNDYDCGLFVLYFMERFIDVAPQRLKKKDLAMFSSKWFKPEEASSLRRKVRKLLMDEFRNATRQTCVLDQDPLSFVGPQEERFGQPIDC